MMSLKSKVAGAANVEDKMKIKTAASRNIGTVGRLETL